MQVAKDLGLALPHLLINMFSFVVLMTLLSKVLFKPVQGMLEQRAERIRKDREAGESFRVEMERKATELDQRLSNIEAEVRDRMQAAEREANRLREAMLDDARAEREALVAAGLQELRREREKALVEIRNLVADLAMLAAGKVIEEELDVDAHRALIDDIVEHGVRS